MSLARETKQTLRLAFPLVIGQLSQMLLGVVDTIMIGRLGVTGMAVLTFANSLFYVPFVFGIGILSAVSVFTARASGAADHAAGRGSCRNGMYVAVCLGVFLWAAVSLLSMNLGIFRQPADVAAQTEPYLRIIMASLVPGLMSIALKNHADALDRPWPPFWIFLGGVVLNILLNWLLIFGKAGLPALGLNGAAWATLISRFAILGGMLVWLHRGGDMRIWTPYRWLRIAEYGAIRRFLAIGFPAGAQMIFEVAAFSGAGLMMGRFGKTAMAAHQIALMCAATAFMIPLGLAMALSVRIGAAAGAGESQRLREIVVSGWGIGGAYALVSAILFALGGEWLASIFIEEAPVIRMAARIMVVVGIFQLFDSLQAGSVSMLRGLHDARVPALIGFIAYWLIGIPLAAVLPDITGLGAVAVWIGLAAGLLAACLMLVPRLWKMTAPAASTVHPS